MSRVDLDRNRSSLLQAFNEVSNPKNSTDWALFGYEAKTTALKVVATGEDGIEELADDLNSGKIQYAYCRVKDPNTGLPKFVFINWQGEGAPEMMKGKCSNHVSDVQKFFKGAHVTIHARTEDDVDADEIINKVAKASGANYSIHKEKPQNIAPSGPVGSVYQKTKPHVEIKPKLREDFWTKMRQEEKDRQEGLQRQTSTEMSKLDTDRRERELQEAQSRDSKESSRMEKINDRKQAERRADQAKTAADKEAWEKDHQADAMNDDQERKKRADVLRKERANEAQSLLSQRQNDPKTMFQQKPVSQFDQGAAGGPAQPPPVRKLKHAFGAEPAPQPEGRKKQIQLPTEHEGPTPTSPPPVARAPAASPPRREPEPPSATPIARAPAASPPRREPEPPSPPAPTADVPHTRNLLAEALPRRQDSDEEAEAEEQNWDESKPAEPSTEDFTMPSAGSAPSYPDPQELYDDVSHEEPKDIYDDVSHEEPQDVYDDVSHIQQQEEPQDIYDDVTNDSAGQEPEDLYDDVKPAGATEQQFTPEMGVVARALYDYQAAEENEISFDPDEILTNIDQIDPGWWVGVTPDGSQGMFPSNYVEIIHQ